MKNFLSNLSLLIGILTFISCTEKHHPSHYIVSEDGQVLERWLNGRTTEVDMEGDWILNEVTIIGREAFANQVNINAIKLPDNLEIIEDSAFKECVFLEEITIPKGVTTIGSMAFMGCTSLTSITIPEGVTTIGSMAFMGCTSLTSITIPEGVTGIGVGAFFRLYIFDFSNYPGKCYSHWRNSIFIW
ncbi:leucine-rich repeat domain-containing protein [Capnocytophaga canimorsus]|nr:leucine-rich repeat domain-containing protein [Capnocytophaga canimorsus]WGU67612.1 leucine-rich repeat domain-containing protein [Capnocytophaga canimorsus]WGU71270.1 leucine-rich repeat domain-containing protein [Capnocytophaga canimorsus]